jgi:hypothetical protein
LVRQWHSRVLGRLAMMHTPEQIAVARSFSGDNGIVPFTEALG